MTVTRLRSLEARLDARTIEGPLPAYRPDLGPCRLWTGATNGDGYGVTRDDDGQLALAHRAAYEKAHGPIPDNLPLDHLCRVRNCCHPDHTEPVTTAENNRRSIAARRAS